MIAVITGDIINSQQAEAELWMQKLKTLFRSWAQTPSEWEIYRGDEFQYKCAIDEVFTKIILIKSLVKTFENLDVRLAVGIGTEIFSSEKITESNGSAYVNSGRLLNEIKLNGRTLAIKTPNENINTDLNILFQWTSLDFDSWTAVSAEIIHIFAQDSTLSQEQVANQLNISQSSVSQRLKRVNYDLITMTDRYFRKKISQL
ncbi:winged helix-turn-helix transcriptional regulator [Chryseobacterium lacus]|uniref:Winged helix-turn-helix transcriptional regulator n=1 Tax=Chryseobacterium lacus TaxID=2058346 RepID=A0A368N0F6_9FLAO|nr:SatD family protein [Chryseobacterium lacus]ODS90074.1 MAG: hypothetical protein ABS44_01545 [Chryseobacterium sp. SCN 40-13]RCU42729.1 winged helix-turn-helix transcriptional regulator [Chryseobacterium lacus]RST27292.1 winged helix-turn-helix transcriptional regulator [Chryseobacterium lacus]